jgi:hypothetical protein
MNFHTYTIHMLKENKFLNKFAQGTLGLGQVCALTRPKEVPYGTVPALWKHKNILYDTTCPLKESKNYYQKPK